MVRMMLTLIISHSLLGMSYEEIQKKISLLVKQNENDAIKIERLEAMLNSSQRRELQSKSLANYFENQKNNLLKEIIAINDTTDADARLKQLSRIIAKYKDSDRKDSCYW